MSTNKSKIKISAQDGRFNFSFKLAKDSSKFNISGRWQRNRSILCNGNEFIFSQITVKLPKQTNEVDEKIIKDLNFREMDSDMPFMVKVIKSKTTLHVKVDSTAYNPYINSSMVIICENVFSKIAKKIQ